MVIIIFITIKRSRLSLTLVDENLNFYLGVDAVSLKVPIFPDFLIIFPYFM